MAKKAGGRGFVAGRGRGRLPLLAGRRRTDRRNLGLHNGNAHSGPGVNSLPAAAAARAAAAAPEPDDEDELLPAAASPDGFSSDDEGEPAPRTATVGSANRGTKR